MDGKGQGPPSYWQTPASAGARNGAAPPAPPAAAAAAAALTAPAPGTAAGAASRPASTAASVDQGGQGTWRPDGGARSSSAYSGDQGLPVYMPTATTWIPDTKAGLAASAPPAAAPPQQRAGTAVPLSAGAPPPPPPPPSYLPPHMESYEAWYRAGVPWRRTEWLPDKDRRTLVAEVTERGIAAADVAGFLYKLVAAYWFTPEDCARVIQASCLRRPLPTGAVALAVETARIVVHALVPINVAQVVALMAALPSTDVEYLARYYFLEFLLPLLVQGLEQERKMQPLPASFVAAGPAALPTPHTAPVQLSSSDIEAIALAVHPKAIVPTCQTLLRSFPGARLSVVGLTRLLDSLPRELVVSLAFASTPGQAPEARTVSLRFALLQLSCERLLAAVSTDEACEILRRFPPSEVADVVVVIEPRLQPIPTFTALHAVLKLVPGDEPPGAGATVRLAVFRTLFRTRLAQHIRDLAALPPLLALFVNATERLQVLHACLHRAVPPTLEDSRQLLERFPQASEQRATAFYIIVEVWLPPVDYESLRGLLALVAPQFRQHALALVDKCLPPIPVDQLAAVLHLIPNSFRYRLLSLEALRDRAGRFTCDQLMLVLNEFDPGSNRLEALSMCVHLLTDASVHGRVIVDSQFTSPADRRDAANILQRAGF